MIVYISLDEAIQKMDDLYKADCDTYGASIPECFDNDRAIKALKELSTFEEPRKGKWTIKNGELAFWDVCSECGRMVIHKAPFYNFCPHCGTDMREESDSK